MSLMLNVMVDGRKRLASPYDPATMRETARELDEQLPALRQLGRVAVFVNDGNVAHIVVAR